MKPNTQRLILIPDLKTRSHPDENCPCEFYNRSLSNPTPSPLVTYEGWNYFKCMTCRKKFSKDESQRYCRDCKTPMRKYFDHRRGKTFYYFCPDCFPVIKRLQRDSGIPLHFQKSLSALDRDKINQDALDDFTALAKDPSLLNKGSILLIGQTGSGKTTLASALGTS